MTVDICVQHGGREALHRVGLSAAPKTCLSNFYKNQVIHILATNVLFAENGSWLLGYTLL